MAWRTCSIPNRGEESTKVRAICVPTRAEAWSTRVLAEVDLEIGYFPDAGRDNDGDLWGPIEGEVLLYPTKNLSLFTEGDYNVETGGRFDIFRTGARLSANNGSNVTIANIYRRHLSHSLTSRAVWVLSPKYSAEMFYEYDFRREKVVNQEYAVIRHFHRWVAAFSVEIDEGEDDNVTVSVAVGPRDLIQLGADRRDR